jgi:multiple antibiotic resistance protein
MTDFVVLVVIFLAAVNPAWAALTYGRLGNGAEPARAGGRIQPVTVGAAIAAGLLLAGVVLAESLLEGLSLEPETFRVAAGIVMAAMGVTAILGRRPIAIDQPDDWSRGVYPLAIPLFAGPAALVAAVMYSLDEGRGQAAAAALIVIGVAAVLSLVVRPRVQPLLAAAAPILGGLLVIIAVGLIVDGVQAI